MTKFPCFSLAEKESGPEWMNAEGKKKHFFLHNLNDDPQLIVYVCECTYLSDVLFGTSSGSALLWLINMSN